MASLKVTVNANGIPSVKPFLCVFQIMKIAKRLVLLLTREFYYLPLELYSKVCLIQNSDHLTAFNSNFLLVAV